MSTISVDTSKFEKIMALPSLRDRDPPHESMKLWTCEKASLTCYYAPFEYLNVFAVICETTKLALVIEPPVPKNALSATTPDMLTVSPLL